MLHKKQIGYITFLLFFPWFYLLYSFFAPSSGAEGLLPPNQCVQLIKINNSLKTADIRDNISTYHIYIPTEANFDRLLFFDLSYKKNKIYYQKKKNKSPLKVLVVGDSIGEGLYLAYHKYIKKRYPEIKGRFFVKHSTTTYKWINNKRFFKELSSQKYDILLISLGANEWATDDLSLMYNISRFYFKVKKTNPYIKIYWIVPYVRSDKLRKFIEYFVGRNYSIPLEDFVGVIPLSKDKVHPDMKKKGYLKLWHVILDKIDVKHIEEKVAKHY